jgi:hypothetical protein
MQGIFTFVFLCVFMAMIIGFIVTAPVWILLALGIAILAWMMEN